MVRRNCPPALAGPSLRQQARTFPTKFQKTPPGGSGGRCENRSAVTRHRPVTRGRGVRSARAGRQLTCTPYAVRMTNDTNPSPEQPGHGGLGAGVDKLRDLELLIQRVLARRVGMPQG